MTFWQENYAFIKDVYDTRASKLNETMTKCEQSIADVIADKIYTSAEFKKVKEVFMGLAKNLEQPEVKEWLAMTKDTLMGDKSGKEQDEEAKKLNGILRRYDEMMPKIAETKNIVDALWKSYQFTDELAPLMEWLEEMVSKSTREINSNSASQTEEIQEKQEKIIDQLDKKKKVVVEQQTKGEKLTQDPKAPKFLITYIDRLKALWVDANKQAENRLAALKDNLSAWERYERERDGLAAKLDAAEGEMMDTKRVYDLVEGPKDYQNRLKTAAEMRKDIEATFQSLSGANDILAKLLTDDKKAELAEEVENLKCRLSILESMDEKLKMINDFNGQLKEFEQNMKELAEWLGVGRKRMDELIKPAAPISAEDRVVQTMELLSDCKTQAEKLTKHMEKWSELQPSASGENTAEAQALVARMDEISSVQGKLIGEVEAEGAKYGDDVKYLADFTSGVKKFDPWIQKSEAKKAVGMTKPKNLQEALDQLEDAKKWKKEAEELNAVLEESYKQAQKMTLHDDADTKYAAYKKRWVVVDETAKDWMDKLQAMVGVWQKQAETVEKVQAAIASKPSADGGEMKLEDLEKHLDLLKQMFIEKQKMMEQLEGGKPAAAAPAPAPAPAPAAST
jgi:hypothetical protein